MLSELLLNPEFKMFLQLALAAALGGLIGVEREQKGTPAGMRTQALVALGACLFTILSLNAFPGADVARVAAQIVIGIGFIGAGLIIFREEEHKLVGLTTAATIWAVAALGMAVGAEKYIVAVLGTVLVYFILAVLSRVKIGP